jgi:hypothetical protein
MSKSSTASQKLSIAYLGKNQSTELEAQIRAKIFNEIAHVNEFYRNGLPKSATAILVEVMAIIRGN